jgi:hypothetical protein
VGDSHTYGAPLPAEESYPSQLQDRLDAHSQGTYRVVNLGIPGINSAMVSHRFEDNLVRYRPDLVILWVGANNIWNEQETEAWDEGDGSGWLRRAVLRIKLVRLFRFLTGGVAAAGGGRAERLQWSPQKSATWQLGDETIHLESQRDARVPEVRAGRGARIDLAHMVGVAPALDVPILLVTYPYPYPVFAYANDAVRAVAREANVDLVETTADMARASADGHTVDDLFVLAAGPHPRGLLYGYIVDSMAPLVLSLLASQ